MDFYDGRQGAILIDGLGSFLSRHIKGFRGILIIFHLSYQLICETGISIVIFVDIL